MLSVYQTEQYNRLEDYSLKIHNTHRQKDSCKVLWVDEGSSFLKGSYLEPSP